MSEATIESEVKIPVADIDDVRRELMMAGGEPIAALARESNVLFDTADGRLAASDRVLRLRRYGSRQVLTLKGPARYEDGVRQREELELDVGDLEAMATILERLAYAPALRYEKDRERWRIAGVTVELDRTPMGDFVELEGPPHNLAATAQALGLEIGDAVAGSYTSLWEAYRRAHPERHLPVDMVFPR